MVDYYYGIEKPWKLFGASKSEWENPKWQRAHFIEDPHKLARFIDLTEIQIRMIGDTIGEGKPMRVSPYAVSLMLGGGRNPSGVGRNGDSTSETVHPLFTRYVKMPDQFMFRGGTADPLGDDDGALGRLSQRYVDRAAHSANSSANCDGFCNWCQRDRFLHKRSADGAGDSPEFEYVRDNQNIGELLQTGGDAFTLTEERLEHDLGALTRIYREKAVPGKQRLRSIRIATGVLSTNPFAITPRKLEIIRKYMKKVENHDLPNIYVVTHLVSLPELTEDVQNRILMMKDYGLAVKNQTVLLKNVNDDFPTMSRLLYDMNDMGNIPYYIFECHKRSGCEGVIVPMNEGMFIADALGGQAGGSSRVTYAVNLAGRGGKVVLTPDGVGKADFNYRRETPLRNCQTGEIVPHEELLRVRESDFRAGIHAMSEFLGDPAIKKFDDGGLADGMRVQNSKSGKYRPSILVVADDDPGNILYVTNVTNLQPMTLEQKCAARGYVPNGEELGHPNQTYITTPRPLAGRYGIE
jgi:lysine 2,3-aminomutase